jgi:hypothetical protein
MESVDMMVVDMDGYKGVWISNWIYPPHPRIYPRIYPVGHPEIPEI